MARTERDLGGVLVAVRAVSTSTTDQGCRFERLSRAALTAHDGADGTQRFRRVWLWEERWPGKTAHDHVDTGIDLVAEQTDGTLAAVQCKFYKGAVPTSAVDSFLAASSRPEFVSRIVMTTGAGFQRHGRNKLHHAHPPCDVFDLDRMGAWNVDWWELAEQCHAIAPGTPRQRSLHRNRSLPVNLALSGWHSAKRYYGSVGTRLNAVAERSSRIARLLLRTLLAAEAVIVTALLAAVAAAAVMAVVVLFTAWIFLAVAQNKPRRRRDRWL